jgi:uncharacterized membrane protein YhaH (DUF805 family)
MASDTFEQALLAAQAEGSLNAAWKTFVNTRFYVPIVHAPDLDPRKSKIHTAPGTAAGGEAVLISEVRERVAHGDAVLWLNGAEIVKMLHAEAGILVALSDRAFAIAHDKVDWLRKGIEQAQARAAAKLQPSGATIPAKAPAAPIPAKAPVPLAKAPAATPSSMAQARTAPAAPPPAQRPKAGALDVAALKPRAVEVADLGLSFFVPGAWREERSTKVLRFHDQASGVRAEVSGFHRPGLQLEQWVGMRVALVESEMRFLTQDGPSYAISGEGWRDRISGRAVEFTGTFPGESVPGRYMVACIHIDGTVMSVAFRAKAEVFEQQRALFQWLLSRIELAGQEALAAYRAPAPRAGAVEFDDRDFSTPGPIGLSMQGRIGRLRALAYSVPAMLPFVAVAIGAALLMPKHAVLGGVMAITGVVLMLWFSLRLMVLRLHDVNLSGKWILGFLVLSGVAGATQKPALLLGVSALFWLFMLVIYCLVPGTDDDNDYGPPPAPNTPLVQIGAGVFILFQVLGLYGNLKHGGVWNPRAMTAHSAGDERAGPAMVTFRSPDNSFVVDLPGQPAELPNSAWLNSQMGNVVLRQFHLETVGHAYLIQTMDFGAAAQDRYAMMNRAEQAVAGRDGTLGASKPFLFNNGVNGREVRARTPDGSLRVARLVFVGSKLVVVMIGGVDETRDSALVEQVFKSFQLV